MTKKIYLSGKRGEGRFALVDDGDYKSLAKCNWYLDNNGYASDTNNVKMHRVLLPTVQGYLVDHRDRDRLNNQRENLRIATPSQNAANKTTSAHRRFKGVYRAGNGQYRAVCRGVDLGKFPSAITAANAYNREALIQYGEFASLNVAPK